MSLQYVESQLKDLNDLEELLTKEPAYAPLFWKEIAFSLAKLAKNNLLLLRAAELRLVELEALVKLHSNILHDPRKLVPFRKKPKVED